MGSGDGRLGAEVRVPAATCRIWGLKMDSVVSPRLPWHTSVRLMSSQMNWGSAQNSWGDGDSRPQPGKGGREQLGGQTPGSPPALCSIVMSTPNPMRGCHPWTSPEPALSWSHSGPLLPQTQSPASQPPPPSDPEPSPPATLYMGPHPFHPFGLLRVWPQLVIAKGIGAGRKVRVSEQDPLIQAGCSDCLIALASEGLRAPNSGSCLLIYQLDGDLSTATRHLETLDSQAGPRPFNLLSHRGGDFPPSELRWGSLGSE